MESGRKKSYAFTILACAIVAVLSIAYIDHNERQARATHDEKVTTLGQIFQQFGYGGAIHAFKNYALRGGEHYRQLAEKKLSGLTALVGKFEASASTTSAESKAIAQVSTVIEEYRRKLAIARDAIAQGTPPGPALDQLVRVDDEQALDGIAAVITLLDADQKTLSRSSRNKRLLAALVLTSFFLINFFLYLREIGYLERTNASLVTANEELLQFSYRSSHDLKAPLITIRGLSTCILEDIEFGDYDEVKANVSKISMLAARLEQLVSGLLQLARADLNNRGNDELDIAKIVDDIYAANLTIANAADVRMIQDINLPDRPIGSKPVIELVLSNLIVNAIKYADPQREESYVKVRASNDGHALKIEVADNGLGIRDDYQSKVFGIFEKFHPSQSGGSGLGLYMIKKTVERLAGTIHLDSKYGEGSTFRVSIPLQANL